MMLLCRRVGCARSAALAAAPPHVVMARSISSMPRSPWTVLDIPAGSSKAQIKRRFYELAKQTHPDTAMPPLMQHLGTATTAPRFESPAEKEFVSFLEIREAYEVLLGGQVPPPPAAPSTSSPNAAARGCTGSPGASARRTTPMGRVVTRQKTRGDFMCDRLRAEPRAAIEVWRDIVAEQLAVTQSMLEELARACGARGGWGLDGALYILRNGTSQGLLSPQQREVSRRASPARAMSLRLPRPPMVTHMSPPADATAATAATLVCGRLHFTLHPAMPPPVPADDDPPRQVVQGGRRLLRAHRERDARDRADRRGARAAHLRQPALLRAGGKLLVLARAVVVAL